MSTPLRIEVPNAIYHFTARGNNRQVIYRRQVDYETFLMLLARVARKHRWVILGYCLMGNHYHLVVQVPFAAFSGGFNELNGGFARVMNVRYDRCNHLFGRRFYSKLIVDDQHMLETARYVVLNPVRAGICARPEEWPWSSYRACAGLEHGPGFLAVAELLGHFGDSPEAARAEYRRFVADGRVRVAATVTEA